jgi:FKBP-type peptidyl-prolyl cis-trans isomerase 2
MKTKYLLLAAMGFALMGCAKENTPSAGEVAREYLSLWIDKYHPGIAPNADGLYILQDNPGTGDLWDAAKAYSYLEVTVRGLNGVISSTTDSTLSKQLGTYVKGNYYGPRFQATGEGSSYAGFDALLTGMRVGGSREAVVPAWMLTTSRFETQQEYLDESASSTSLIYGVTLRGQTDDISEVEKDSLARYVFRKYGSVAPTTYKSDEDPDGTFYFISDTSAFVNSDIKPRGASDNGTLNYTGRLLNGQVFDSNVERVAKDAGLYNSGNSYVPASITFASEWNSISMGSSTSLIDGFKGGLYKLRYPGQKAIVVFTSTHGYTTTGKGNSIPAWSPLEFELELVSVESLD